MLKTWFWFWIAFYKVCQAIKPRWCSSEIHADVYYDESNVYYINGLFFTAYNPVHVLAFCDSNIHLFTGILFSLEQVGYNTKCPCMLMLIALAIIGFLFHCITYCVLLFYSIIIKNNHELLQLCLLFYLSTCCSTIHRL